MASNSTGRPAGRTMLQRSRSPRMRRTGPSPPASGVRAPRSREAEAVDLGRERLVDLELGLAGGLALLERGIVQEWEAHGALDLEGAVACEEHRRRMGVDALDRRATKGRTMGRG